MTTDSRPHSGASRILHGAPLGYYFGAFRRYADFTGRATRAQYWFYVLLYLIAYVVAGVIGVSLGSLTDQEWIAGVVIALFLLGHIVPTIAIGARRLHDAGYSGLFLLLGLLPLAGIAVFVLSVLPGTPGPNKWGPDPRAR